MRSTLLALLLLAPLTAAAASDHPIFIELYTSDACPACPAADALLHKLIAPGAFPGIDIVALEWHTSSWNTASWADGLALPEGEARQLQYLPRLVHMKSPFTPQVIVSGSHSFIGTDEDLIRAAITSDAQEPLFQISATALGGDRVRIRCPVLPAGGGLFLAATETDLATTIPSGRHAGKPITHGPVVRWFKQVTLTKAGRVDTTEAVPMAATWTRSHVRWVVWAQNGEGRVLGAAYAIPR
jgi:hypothetical protein